MDITELKCLKCALESKLREVKRELKKFYPEARTKLHKPLKRNTATDYESSKWRVLVFALHGNQCYWCGGLADQACHIIGKGMRLGKQRYCTPLNGVPGCGPCHELQTLNKRKFPLDTRQIAVRALNRHLKIPMIVPTE